MPAFSYPVPSLSTSPGDPFGSLPAAGSFSGATDNLPDYPLYDATTGTYISRKTRKPYTGSYQGLTFNQGQQQPTGPQQAAAQALNINPNDPSQRYKAVNVVKQPDVASAETDLMKQFTDSADSALKDFNQYLASFKSDLAGARTAGAAATDITPTVNALTQAQQQYSGALGNSNAAYQTALANSAANTRGVVNQELGTLPQYDTALSNIEQAQLAALQPMISKYKLGTGTPTSLGTDEQRILARAAGEVALPIELQKIQAQQGILQNAALPVEQQIGGQNISYAGSFLPGVAGQQFGSATSLANTIQSLKSQVASMSLQQAIAYMQAAGVPPAVMQQVLGTNISQAGALSSLESGANYQGLQDLLGYNLTQPAGGMPGLPGLPNYAPRTGNSLGPNAPVTVGPGAPAVAPGGVGIPNYLSPSGGVPSSTINGQLNPQYTAYLQYLNSLNPGQQDYSPSSVFTDYQLTGG